MVAQTHELSGHRGNEKLDSEAPVLQESFEWLACWAVVLAFPIGIVIVTADALDMAFPQGRAGVHALIALSAGLVAGIAIVVWGDSTKGKRVARQTQRIVHRDMHFSWRWRSAAWRVGIGVPDKLRMRSGKMPDVGKARGDSAPLTGRPCAARGYSLSQFGRSHSAGLVESPEAPA